MDGLHTTYKPIATPVDSVDSATACGVLCTDSATSCHHSNGSMCLPPDGGCCAFSYDNELGSCDLYSLVTPREDENVPDFTSVMSDVISD